MEIMVRDTQQLRTRTVVVDRRTAFLSALILFLDAASLPLTSACLQTGK